MKKILQGEYDNYDFRTADEVSKEDLIVTTRNALNSARELYKIKKTVF